MGDRRERFGRLSAAQNTPLFPHCGTRFVVINILPTGMTFCSTAQRHSS
jgi:hypothetical protein